MTTIFNKALQASPNAYKYASKVARLNNERVAILGKGWALGEYRIAFVNLTPADFATITGLIEGEGFETAKINGRLRPVYECDSQDLRA